jgi:hypothetical protein
MTESAVVCWRKTIFYDHKTQKSAYQNVVSMVVGFEKVIPMLGEELDVVTVDMADCRPLTYHDEPYPHDRALEHFRGFVEKYGATDAAKIALGLIKPPRFKRRRT